MHDWVISNQCFPADLSGAERWITQLYVWKHKVCCSLQTSTSNPYTKGPSQPFSLSLYVTLFTDPSLDCGYMPWCSECSESPWYPPKRGSSSLDACQGHVSSTNQRNPGCRWIHTHQHHQWWWVGSRWLACGCILSFFLSCHQVKRWHCQWRDHLVQDAPATFAITQRPSDWVEVYLLSGSMDCPRGKKSSCCTCHFCCPRVHVFCGW